MAGLASAGSFLLVAIVVALLLPAPYGSQSNCPPTDPGHGGGGGSGYNPPPHHGKPPKHHKCPPCHPPPTPRPPPYAPPTPPYKPPTPPYVPPYKPPTPPYKPPTPPYTPPSPPYTPPYVPPSPPYTPPYAPPTPPYVPPPSPPYAPPTPPYSPPYGPPPGHGGKTCPIDALKLNACVDVLSGLVHVVIGREARSKCCPLVQGVADLDATLCLCTTIRARVLSIDLYLPLALRLLITCGKHPPNGFSCPKVLDA